MEIVASDNLFLAFLLSNSILNSGVDWLIKSFSIIGLTLLLVFILQNKLSSSSKHLLWLNSLTCVVLVPLISALLLILEAPQPFAATLISLQVTPTTSNMPIAGAVYMFPFSWIVIAIYLVSASILLLRLFNSLLTAVRFVSTTERVQNSRQIARMLHWQTQLGISRAVQLRYSTTVNTPLSIGLIRPTIVLPAQAKSWKTDFLDDVLIHELGHIKRLDWVTMLFAHIVTSIIWINPLAWLALRRLHEEAENSCDSTVLRLKGKETDYAETLCSIARNIKQERNPPFFAQTMLDKSTLSNRIHRILESNMARSTTHRLFVLPMLALVVTILAACTSTQLMTAESPRQPPSPRESGSRGVILPIEAPSPQYPSRAAFDGIEGWALVEFDVLANGDVAPESIRIVDSEPAVIFDRSSMRAAGNFKFEPVGGVAPQAISGVQYLFRFALGEEGSSNNSINRDLQPINAVIPEFPVAARSNDIAGASVWTVFHVTRAGTVQDVMVRYSSNEIFNASAIAAAEQLRFQPRSANDAVQGNVRGDTSGLVRAQYLFRFE